MFPCSAPHCESEPFEVTRYNVLLRLERASSNFF